MRKLRSNQIHYLSQVLQRISSELDKNICLLNSKAKIFPLYWEFWLYMKITCRPFKYQWCECSEPMRITKIPYSSKFWNIYLKMFQRFINQIQNIVRYVILYKNTLLIADVSLLVISVWPWQNNNVLLYPDVKDDYF